MPCVSCAPDSINVKNFWIEFFIYGLGKLINHNSLGENVQLDFKLIFKTNEIVMFSVLISMF